jgi:hypothetical protein
MFGSLCSVFTVLIADTWYHLGIAKIYRKKGRSKVTGYIELEIVPGGKYDIIFLDTIIRSAHILPPTPKNPRFIVQDLYDADSYLRLLHVK